MVKVNVIEKEREANCGEPETCCGYSYFESNNETVELTDEQFALLKKQVKDLSYTEYLWFEDLDFELKYVRRVYGFKLV